MRRITFFIFLLSFLLLRPFEFERCGLLFPTDDEGYFAHATSIVYGRFPYYDKEFFFGEDRPMETIGPALLALPFVSFFSLFDRLAGAPIVARRTLENVESSWSLFGYVLATSFYFYLGCWLLFKGLRYYVEERPASWAVIFMVLFQGVPVFVFRRPLFSHGYEFFVQALLVFLLLKFSRARSALPPGPSLVALIGLAVGVQFLIRYNDLSFALIWPLVLLINTRADLKNARVLKRMLAVFMIAAVPAGIFYVLPGFFVPGGEGYAASGVPGLLLHGESPLFYLRRLGHILFGVDWGLLYTAPFLLVGLGAFTFLRFPLKRKLSVLLLPVLLNLYIVMMWKTQGGSYGYRYLFVSAVPVLALPLAWLLQESEQRNRTVVWRLFGLLSVLPLLSMLCFEGNTTTLGTRGGLQYFGVAGNGNNTYQLGIWGMALFAPWHLLITLAQGGIFYLVHLTAELFLLTESLPEPVFVRYPVFHLHVLIKTGIIYALPFFLQAVFQRIGRTARRSRVP